MSALVTTNCFIPAPAVVFPHHTTPLLISHRASSRQAQPMPAVASRRRCSTQSLRHRSHSISSSTQTMLGVRSVVPARLTAATWRIFHARPAPLTLSTLAPLHRRLQISSSTPSSTTHLALAGVVPEPCVRPPGVHYQRPSPPRPSSDVRLFGQCLLRRRRCVQFRR